MDNHNDNVFLADLDEKQVEAVLCSDGPVLVFAGAGSGKTRVLTYRVAYLIKEVFVHRLAQLKA